MISTAALRASVLHHGKRVSRAHQIMLAAYERQAHHFAYINQGRRTIAEQWGFWNHYRRYGWPIAAYPSQSAPHIKYGQANHALDINAPEPAHAIANFYRAHGISVAFNVGREPWHMDTIVEAQLLAAARRLAGSGGGGNPVLRLGMHGPNVLRAQKLLRKWNIDGAPRPTGYFGWRTKRAVKRFQKKHGLPQVGIIGPRTWKLLLR